VRGAYLAGQFSHAGHDADLYLDDLYIDHSLARVVVMAEAGGPAEMQIPIAWNDDTITIMANPGHHPGGTDLLLVVHDAENRASNGFQITVESGSGPDSGPPGTPSAVIMSTVPE
jgi:hypothetical protein